MSELFYLVLKLINLSRLLLVLLVGGEKIPLEAFLSLLENKLGLLLLLLLLILRLLLQLCHSDLLLLLLVQISLSRLSHLLLRVSELFDLVLKLINLSRLLLVLLFGGKKIPLEAFLSLLEFKLGLLLLNL